MRDDKRQHRRIKADLHIKYSCLSQIDATPYISEEPSKVKDISQSGLAFVTKEKVPLKTMIQAKIEVPSTPFNIMIMGKVVRCEYVEELNQYVVAIKFIGHLYPELGEIIELFKSESV